MVDSGARVRALIHLLPSEEGGTLVALGTVLAFLGHCP